MKCYKRPTMIKRCHIRVYFKGSQPVVYYNMRLITTLAEYHEYTVEVTNRVLVAKEELETGEPIHGRKYTDLAQAAKTCMNIRGRVDDNGDDIKQLRLAQLSILHGTLMANQVKAISEGGTLAINRRGGYMTITKDTYYEILPGDIVYYTEDDIRVGQYKDTGEWYSMVDVHLVRSPSGQIHWKDEHTARWEALKTVDLLNRITEERIGRDEGSTRCAS